MTMNRHSRRRAFAGALLTVLTTHAFPLPFMRKRVNRTVLCHQCRHAGGQGVDAMNSLDATAMAALASLVYVSGWKNRTLPIEIRAYSSKSKHAWRSGWAAERARWAKCAARAARAAPRVPGVQSAFLPPHGTIQKLGADCAPPFHRRWQPTYYFTDWSEPGPGGIRWHSTTALVARGDAGAVAVAFMGSADMRHAITNVQIMETHEKRGGGKTARGMRGAFERVRGGSITRLDEGKRKDDPVFRSIEDACRGRWLKTNGPDVCRPDKEQLLAGLLDDLASATLGTNAPIWVTGHSLGGALALQLALFAAKRRPRKAHEVRVTTFGEPPIGDRRFFDAQRRRHPRLARRYDRRVAVAAPPGCRPDIVPATTRLVGGGSSAHFAEPRHVCAADPPGNVVAAHAMVGYWRALMDGLRRDFALETLYEGPGFWGSETFDDPLLVEARRKVQKQLQREEERLRKRDKAPFPLRRPRLVEGDESCVEEGLLSS
jgi:hypothetical protein